MLFSKKIAKLKKDAHLQKKEDNTKVHKKTSKYRYREIPLHPKVIPSHIIHQIYGDIPLAEYKGQVVMDMSMYNEFKSYHDITVNEMFEQKIITIKPSIKKDKTPAQWNHLVEQLIKSEEAYVQEWAQTIKGFCHTFSKVMQRQSRKRMKSGLRRKFFAQVTEESESQERTLFLTYPCVQFRFRLRNHNMEMKELLFSESFVGELGYSVDSFVTTVFQEGLPQLMPYDNPMAEYIIKPLIENYFSFGEDGYRTAEFDSVLLLGQGFARDVRFRALFLMNYETSTFGMDVIMAVISRSEPYLLKEKICDPINEDFLQTMMQKEQEVDYFLSAFYDLSIQKRYTNYHSICNIKEIYQEYDEDSDIIVKKFEEESYQ